MNFAAKNGHIEMMKYLNEKQAIGWEKVDMPLLAMSGRFSTIQFLHKKGVSLKDGMIRCVANSGNAPLVKYLHQHGVQWQPDTVDLAIYSEDVAILQYVLDNGALQITQVDPMIAAVTSGKLICLRYLHQVRGYELTENLFTISIRSSFPICFKYLLLNNCPRPPPKKINKQGIPVYALASAVCSREFYQFHKQATVSSAKKENCTLM
eukprot:TRINITY_DN23751_c0_g1_i1.p1 TRINITY_DN23751_c0_g1~~TRINITY_DN23751_c0_g1_i1.p1  ORF type:complete len:208 (-),score=32.86 TRINITY_DN23751_c0_g1_i1:34-657(-)